ncbi:hypothetical protein BX659_11736 [Orenia metallireducens]|uniref:Uncharacterized protein n=1 Tax=Orenia metallireducens TaxID=1413210 RepID=A0A285HHG8_9FIRM|nr:CC/Se motif family (seleno)protein [Orenia metallireducens]PRX27171.1 hypothetical protein BX659_11736 [Orenia metallireducens]SNY35104.1 hypothetical protein SAMN06265827_11936 [Orenia metallireducens]
MEVVIKSKLKEYAKGRNLVITIRQLTVNSCCGGKIMPGGIRQAKTPPQVIEGSPKEDNIADYQKLLKDGITIYLHQNLLASYSKLRLDIKKLGFIKRFTLESFE